MQLFDISPYIIRFFWSGMENKVSGMENNVCQVLKMYFREKLGTLIIFVSLICYLMLFVNKYNR